MKLQPQVLSNIMEFLAEGSIKEAKQGAKPAWREHVRNATATANMY